MPTITRLPAQGDEMFWFGVLDPAGSSSGHTGYRVAGGSDIAKAGIIRFKAFCKSVKFRGKFSSADTGSSLPILWANEALVYNNDSGNPWYNNTTWQEVTIWQSGTGIDEEVEIAVSLVGDGNPFFLGTASSGTTGFDGHCLVIEGNDTPTLECPANLTGTIVALTKTTSKASPAGGNTQAYEARAMCKQYRLKPNATRVTLLGRLNNANAAWATSASRPELTLSHTGLRQDYDLREQDVIQGDEGQPILDGTGYKGPGSRSWQAMVVADGITPGSELWTSLGSSGNGPSALYAVLEGDAETLSTMSDYPELLIGYDGGEGNNRGSTPRNALQIGMFGSPWQGTSNNQLIQSYNASNVRTNVGLFGDDTNYGWGPFQTACAAYPGDVNLAIFCFTYENDWDHGGVYFRDSASTPYQITSLAMMQEIMERFAPAIRGGTVFPATSIITNFNRLYVFPFFLMTRNHFPPSDNLVYIDGIEYQQEKGGGYPPTGFTSSGGHEDVMNMVIDAVDGINTAGYKALNGTDPMAVYIPLEDYNTFVVTHYERTVKIPEVIDGPFSGGRADGGPFLSNDRVHPFYAAIGSYGAQVAIANGTAHALNSVLGLETSAAPEVLDAWVPAAGDRIRVRFDREVDGTGAGLSFTRGGAPLTVTAERVTARIIDYMLDTATIYPGNTLERTYTPASGDITDLYGVEMASFSAQSVDNQSTAVATGSGGGEDRLVLSMSRPFSLKIGGL
jgi:hypothetical protein